MIGQMAIAIALPGFKDLERTVTPGKLKKIQDFCPMVAKYELVL